MDKTAELREVIITARDFKACGHCQKGTRESFEYYGKDYRHFLKHGITAQELLDTGDGQAIGVVERKLGKT